MPGQRNIIPSSDKLRRIPCECAFTCCYWHESETDNVKRIKYTIHATAAGEFPEMVGDAVEVRSAAYTVARQLMNSGNMVTVRHELTMQHVAFWPRYDRPDYLRLVPWITQSIREGVADYDRGIRRTVPNMFPLYRNWIVQDTSAVTFMFPDLFHVQAFTSARACDVVRKYAHVGTLRAWHEKEFTDIYGPIVQHAPYLSEHRGIHD